MGDVLKNLQYALRNSRVEFSKLLSYKSGLVGVCNVAAESIVTFDNVTLNYEAPTCYTLVSADCSPQPRYAVFAKKSDKAHWLSRSTPVVTSWSSPPPMTESKSAPTARW